MAFAVCQLRTVEGVRVDTARANIQRFEIEVSQVTFVSH